MTLSAIQADLPNVNFHVCQNVKISREEVTTYLRVVFIGLSKIQTISCGRLDAAPKHSKARFQASIRKDVSLSFRYRTLGTDTKHYEPSTLHYL